MDIYRSLTFPEIRKEWEISRKEKREYKETRVRLNAEQHSLTKTIVAGAEREYREQADDTSKTERTRRKGDARELERDRIRGESRWPEFDPSTVNDSVENDDAEINKQTVVNTQTPNSAPNRFRDTWDSMSEEIENG